jgi:protein-L-isoaspartate(D-aspartate) O-methyltransferase
MTKTLKILASVAALLNGQSAMSADQDSRYTSARQDMVRKQIEARAIRDPRVLAAMEKVPRHRFVPESERPFAYRDTPLPIGHGQTISQPYIVALMTERVRPAPDARVLEVGTGSGYQAAVLAELVEHVYSIELEPELARTAATILAELGYENVTVRAGDGYLGWPEKAPFDIIILTAAPDHVPQPLLDQLKTGGRLIVPVGTQLAGQELRLLTKDAAGQVREEDIAAVRFVPLRRAKDRSD